MNKLIILGALFTFLLTACPAQKTDDPGKTGPVTPKDTTKQVVTKDNEGATELDELVYEAVGSSTLKIESNARSQAELKGRKEMINTLAAEAKKLIALFIQKQPSLFSGNVNAEEYGKAIEQTMNESTTLRGCKVSEYSQSDNSDTTFAVMEMELMLGYDVIETAVVKAGIQKNYVESGNTEHLKKTFKEFFLKEKKKLLTKPA